MKILVYSLPRTRSSYLLDVLCQHYKLRNYFEPYSGNLAKKVIDKTPKHKYYTSVWDEYKNKTKVITEKLKTEDNFGCKIFAGNLFNWVKYTPSELYPHPNYKELSKNELINAFEYHNVEMYDRIYFTYRKNKADQFCSYEHAYQHDNFMFFKGQEKLTKIYSPKHKSIKYEYPVVKSRVFQTVVYEWFSEKLIETNKNIIKLEYNEIPDYIKTNYPDVISHWIENFYDYPKTIINYNQIVDDCERAKQELLNEGIYEHLESLYK